MGYHVHPYPKKGIGSCGFVISIRAAIVAPGRSYGHHLITGDSPSLDGVHSDSILAGYYYRWVERRMFGMFIYLLSFALLIIAVRFAIHIYKISMRVPNDPEEGNRQTVRNLIKHEAIRMFRTKKR